MAKQQTVSRDEWLEARRAFMAKEKEFLKQRDALSQERRNLPRVKIDKDYVFEGPNGKESLSDLFDGRSQLIIYHFMYGKNWNEGCPSCSFWADNYNGVIAHLNARDISLATISKGPIDKLMAYKKRMAWQFNWVSAMDNDFNEDFHVSFGDDNPDDGPPNYNFGTIHHGGSEAPGLSVFMKDPDGTIYHTYSTYARGLDRLNAAYHLIDSTPKGRDEADQKPHPMAWVRRHDSY